MLNLWPYLPSLRIKWIYIYFKKAVPEFHGILCRFSFHGLTCCQSLFSFSTCFKHNLNFIVLELYYFYQGEEEVTKVGQRENVCAPSKSSLSTSCKSAETSLTLGNKYHTLDPDYHLYLGSFPLEKCSNSSTYGYILWESREQGLPSLKKKENNNNKLISKYYTPAISRNK